MNLIRYILSLIIILVLCSMSLGLTLKEDLNDTVVGFGESNEWYNTSWTHKKNITIDSSKVNGTQTNFPVLINITDTDLRDDAQADGDDILFTDSSDVKLAHEIEFYNNTNGWLVVWVRIPTLSGTSNTTIHMYYGNAAAGNQENVTGVWDSNYVLVHHLEEIDIDGGSGDIKDSTSNSNNGTTVGSMTSSDQVSGQVGGSFDFDGSNDLIYVNDSSSLDSATGAGQPRTFGYWIYSKASNSNKLLSDKYNFHGNSLWGEIQTDYVCGGVTGAATCCTSAGTVSQDKWYKLTYTYNGSHTRIYINGTKLYATAQTAPDDNNYLLRFAGESTNCFTGQMDEIRISNTSRSDGWIKTEYDNQADPSSFYTIGAEEDDSGVSESSHLNIYSNLKIYPGGHLTIYN